MNLPSDLEDLALTVGFQLRGDAVDDFPHVIFHVENSAS
jgi:hypothetical protein